MAPQKISIIDRALAGFLFAFFVGVTAVFFPIVLVLLTRGKAIQFFGLYKEFPVWEMSVLVAAAGIGMALGLDRSAELLGHFWGTEQPRRTEVTVGLWIFFIAVALFSYWIARKQHGI